MVAIDVKPKKTLKNENGRALSSLWLRACCSKPLSKSRVPSIHDPTEVKPSSPWTSQTS
jgi:hypothetical protein